MATEFEPFANERDILRIGDLEIENRVDRVTLTGDLVVTKDQAGLAKVRELQALLERVRTQLLGDTDLPEAVAVKPVKTVRNPFA